VEREPVAPRRTESLRRGLWIALGLVTIGGVAVTRFVLDRAALAASPVAQPLWHVVAVGGGGDRPRLTYTVALGLVWGLIALGATWAGIARGRSMLGRPVAVKLAVATLTPIALGATWLALALSRLGALDDAPETRMHVHCALMSVAYAVGPWVAFFAVRRGTDPVHPRWGGAAIGAVAGAWGAALYIASCGCSSPGHVALAHLLPVAVLAASGALVGKRILGLRSHFAS
jgi:hypothetical protein